MESQALSMRSQEIVFDAADPTIREFLVDFAIASNDIYQTRTASIDVARAVFEIANCVFKKGAGAPVAKRKTS